MDMGELKAYVSNPGSNGFQNRGGSTVILAMTHSNLKANVLELRLDRHMSILSVKEKAHSHFGTAVADMRLVLKDWDGNPICDMDDNEKKLGFYTPEDGWVLHVIDTDPKSLTTKGQLEDLSQVEKYVMPDEQYDQLENTYRKFKAKKLAEDPTWTFQKEIARRQGREVPEDKDPEEYADIAATITVGDRCEVNPGERRGEVKFVGKCPELKPGYWVGVALDEPQGKNDGSVKGVQYFECMPNCGTFVRPNVVTVGDFPVVDEFDLSDDGEI
jgi:tubulin-folding cofactor B